MGKELSLKVFAARVIICWVFLMVVNYLIGSFLNVSFDISIWTVESRQVVSYVAYGVSGAYFFITAIATAILYGGQ